MDNFVVEFFDFLSTLTPGRFVRLFWFFVLFDFTRYVFFELLVLTHSLISRASLRDKYDTARSFLYGENPLVSIIVPGKNEGKHIKKLALSLKWQTYKNIEIIIVDDGSDDDTYAICSRLRDEKLIDLYVRHTVRGGKASAANTGLRFCKGKFVVHLDADSYLYIDAIEKLLLPFYIDSQIGAVGGDIRVSNAYESLPTSLQAIEYAKSISIGRRVSSALGILRIISGAFGVFRKDILDRLNGWDVGPGLDGDITLKIRKLGFKTVFEPGAVCFTSVPNTFTKLSRQRYRWDRSFVRFRLRKHNDLFMPQANFKILNLVTVVDNTLFNLILNINWWFYAMLTLFSYKPIIVHIIVGNYLLYILSNIIQFTVAQLLAPNREVRERNFMLFLYLPAVPLYTGLYLRIVRSFAYVNELLWFKSYEDRWNPWKVSNAAKKHNL